MTYDKVRGQMVTILVRLSYGFTFDTSMLVILKTKARDVILEGPFYVNYSFALRVL